jgi:hypothetical protein
VSDLLERWQTIEAIEMYRAVLRHVPTAGKAYDVSELIARSLSRLGETPGVVGSPNVYRSLLALPADPEQAGRLSGNATFSIATLKTSLDSVPEADTEWRAAKAISYMIASTPATSGQLLHVGRFVSAHWKLLVKLAPELTNRVIEVFKDPDSTCCTKLQTLAELDDQSINWEIDPRVASMSRWVRDALLIAMIRRAFVWPLVVAAFKSRFAATDVEGAWVGIAVPIALDVEYQHQQYSGLQRDTSPEIKTISSSETEGLDWTRTIGRAREAAYWLWRVRHGYHGKEARAIKRLAQITVDSTVSEKLLSPLIEAQVIQTWATAPPAGEVVATSTPPSSTAPLEDNSSNPFSSAESYFAIQIFGHHARRPLSTATAITGSIGAPIITAPPSGTPSSSESEAVLLPSQLKTPFAAGQPMFIADYELAPADCLAEKFAFCRRSEVFSRLIARTISEEDLPRVLNEPLGFEVTRVTTLQQAVRAGFGQHATPQRYARLPEEVAKRAGAENKTHAAIIKKIRENTGSVLLLDDDLSDVLAALRIVDVRLRRLQTAARRVPPRFAWVGADLTGVRPEHAWLLLWDFCDGDLNDLNRFLQSRTLVQRTEAVEHLLNRFADDARWEGLRAPDLLVLQLGRRTWVPSKNISLDVEDILSNASLTRSTDERLDAFLGATRIIIVRPTANVYSSEVVPSPQLPSLEMQVDYDSLRVFRTAVDVHVMSRFLARVGSGEPAERTKALLDSGRLKRVGWDLYLHREQRGSSAHLGANHAAEFHVAAALALVPLLNLTGALPTDIDRGHSAETLIEATWHIHRAERALRDRADANKGQASPLSALSQSSPQSERQAAVRSTIARAVASLQGALLPPSWASVEVLTSHNPTLAVRMMTGLVASEDILALPTHQLFAALGATWKSRREGSVDQAEQEAIASNLLAEICHRVSHVPPDEWVESGAGGLGAFLPTDPGWKDLSRAVAAGLDALRPAHLTPPFFVNNRWALYWAWDELDNRRAIARYEAIAWWVRMPIQLLVEMVGAMRRSGIGMSTRRPVVRKIDELCGSDRDEWLRRIKRRVTTTGRGARREGAAPPHARDRALAGLEYVRDECGHREKAAP